MLLPHAITLAEARTCLAALADRTDCLDVSEEYDRALLYLDAMHGADVPALSDTAIDDTELVYRAAVRAIESLRDFHVDDLQVEIVLAMIADAHSLDQLGWADETGCDQHDSTDITVSPGGVTSDPVELDPLELDWDSLLGPEIDQQPTDQLPTGGAES